MTSSCRPATQSLTGGFIDVSSRRQKVANHNRLASPRPSWELNARARSPSNLPLPCMYSTVPTAIRASCPPFASSSRLLPSLDRSGSGQAGQLVPVRRRCNGEGGSWWTFTGRLGYLASLGCFPKSAFSRVIDRPKYVRIALLQYYRPLDSAPAVLDVVLLAWTRQNIASIWNRQFLC